MIEKTLILYKGDIILGSIYLGIGSILFCIAVGLHYFTHSLGFTYLSIGFFMFFLYCLGKGIYVYYVANNKLSFFKKFDQLGKDNIQEEITYTEFRITKKNKNRRAYIWMIILGSILAFAGIFSNQKGLIMGTAIPIALISGIEFGMGLLVEFRLREYIRILKKQV